MTWFRYISIALVIVSSLTSIWLVKCDPTPHLRVGNTYLQPETTLMVSYMNRTNLLFCDAFEPVSRLATPEFDGMVWRFGNNNSIIYSVPFTVTNSTYKMYSIIFMPYDGFQNSDNVLLQCCSTLKGKNVMCQATYVMVDSSYYNKSSRIEFGFSKYFNLIAAILVLINLWI